MKAPKIMFGVAVLGALSIFFFTQNDSTNEFKYSSRVTSALSNLPPTGAGIDTESNKEIGIPPISPQSIALASEWGQGDLNEDELEASLTDEPIEDNPYQDQVVKAQFMQIADAYEQDIAYPVYSKPISEDEIDQYIRNQTDEVELPYDLEGLDQPVFFSVKTSKFAYTLGESIPVSVKLSQMPENANIELTVSLASLAGETLFTATEIQAGASDNEFFTRLQPESGLASNWPSELQVNVHVLLDEHRLFNSSPIKYQPSAANLESVNYSVVEESHLLMPLQMNVNLGGYYFVEANLYSQSSGKPLLHLQTEGQLSEGATQLNMRAHIASLKATGDEGPYLLKDIYLVRWSDESIPEDVKGTSSQQQYSVDGHSFDQYQDVAYQDPLSEERLEFLRQLGQL